jgi:hypothetical protein
LTICIPWRLAYSLMASIWFLAKCGSCLAVLT